MTSHITGTTRKKKMESRKASSEEARLQIRHHHIRFWYLRCCGCPGLRVGNTWQRLTLVLHEFLSNGLTPSRLHIVISFFTRADHVFLGLPRSLVPGSSNRVMELMHEVARCTCPCHLRLQVRRTAMISSRSSFW